MNETSPAAALARTPDGSTPSRRAPRAELNGGDFNAATPAERREAGKALRERVPRSAHAGWTPPAGRRDPIELLEESNQGRLPQLVPIRYGRMLASPLAFLRGAAVIMAADLAATPTTGLRVQASGDCHLLNFGGYATPERNLLFDVNDFDETLPAPWEWDVKRLAASLVVAGRFRKFAARDARQAARAAVRSYRERMARYAETSPLDVWYARIDLATLTRLFRRVAAQERRGRAKMARPWAGERVPLRVTTGTGGQVRIADDPPRIFHVPEEDPETKNVHLLVRRYREALPDERRVLLDRYQLVDIALKVVGVGSVGTRCAVALLQAPGNGPLVLQVKEARTSVLEPYAGRSVYPNPGQRIVVGQRLMQAASDLFLGWTRDDALGNYYVRQLRDVKSGLQIGALTPPLLTDYAVLCGSALARAHARSGNPAALRGYLGQRDAFDRAVEEFAVAYADQNERDYEALVAAVRSGRVKAEIEN
jgi:uncharacterized protein (DUF2252 family)